VIEGGCHCGACRYRVDLPDLDDIATCHCSICRRSTGGTHVTWATVPLEGFQWTVGEPQTYRPIAGSERYFCAQCGAQLALWTELSPHTIDITVATLDHPERYPLIVISGPAAGCPGCIWMTGCRRRKRRTIRNRRL
jgi:hypothetical protein